MTRAVDQLWSLAVDRPFVDADALAGAIESASQDPSSLDYRTRLLVRDALGALRGTFGKLTVFSVDPYDIFVGKLFSVRQKDRADLIAMVSRLSRLKLIDRFCESTAALRAEPGLLESAKKNWYVPIPFGTAVVSG